MCLSNQTFRYTRCITSKRVTSLRGPSPIVAPGQHSSYRRMPQRWQAAGNIVSDLTGLRFEPQTSRSRDERVTAYNL